MRPAMILLLATLAAFGWSLAGEFHFDDYSILSNPVLTSRTGWWQVWLPWQTRPLTYFTFWANYQVGGPDPAGYHMVNLLLHVAAVLLLYSVLRHVIADAAAFFAAALFAVHPIQAEAVNYVWARSSVLAAVLCLASWRDWVAGRSWRAVVWFAAALLAKEECVTFPLFLAIWDRSRKVPLAAMLGLSAAAGARLIWATTVLAGSQAGVQAAVGPVDYFLTQGWVVLRYLRELVIPWFFTVDPDIHVWRWAGLGWLVVIGAVVWLWKRQRAVAQWIAGGLVLLAASSSLFPANDLAADRRMYLPMIAFCPAAAVMLVRWSWRWVLVGVLAVLSVWRCEVWRTERSLWTEAFDAAPGKVRPRIQLARHVEFDEAKKILEPIASSNQVAASELGKLMLSAGRPQDALGWFGRALAMSPRDAEALNHRGVALQALGQADAARRDFLAALERNPCLQTARANLIALGVTLPEPRGCPPR